MSVTELNNSNFESEVLKADLPVLVDFWAPWCAPCRMLSPVVEEIAAEKAGSLKVCKLNIDDNPELASRYGVMSIPTLIVFKNGEGAATSVGVQPKEKILGML